MEWINVNESLPENNGQYLTKVSATPFNQKGQVVSDFSTLVYPNFSYDRLHTDRVTHWMPLPEPPKE